MFPPNPLIEAIVKSCLAKAQQHHPVEVGPLVVAATHVHFLARVSNPDDIKGFMERFKTESAHAINRLLGRKKRTLWCEGYDSPVQLKPEDVVNKIVYIYENPSKDDLEDCIEKYPGISSFQFHGQEKGVFEAPLLSRDDIEKLPEGKLGEDDYRRLAKKLCQGKKKIELTLSLNAWMKCFGITEPGEVAEYNKRIVERVREREAEHRARRARENKSVLGRARLVQTAVGAAYVPERSGRRMLCHSSDRECRKSFITWIKSLIGEAREVLACWRMGDFSRPFPLGLYPPSLPKTAEPIFC